MKASLSTFIIIGISCLVLVQNAAADSDDNDDRRLLDPLCRRARSLVDCWGQSFNRGGKSSNPLWEVIEKRCEPPATVRNDEHMICTFLCVEIYTYTIPHLRLYQSVTPISLRRLRLPQQLVRLLPKLLPLVLRRREAVLLLY